VIIKDFKKQEKIRALATLFYDGRHKRWWSKSCKIYLWKEKLDNPRYFYNYNTRKNTKAEWKVFYRFVRFYNDGSVSENRRVSKTEKRRLQLLRY
jgi:hypothetical protein